MPFNRNINSLLFLVAIFLFAGCASARLDPQARKAKEKSLLELQLKARNLEAKKEWDEAADAWYTFLSSEKSAFNEDMDIFEAAFKLLCMENEKKYEFEVKRARRELREIVRLLKVRRISRAEKRLKKLALMKRSLPGSERLRRLVRLRGGRWRKEALYRIAECRFRAGRLLKADEAYERLITEFPRTEQRDEIIEKQYEIGKSLIHGTEIPKVFLFFFHWKGENREAGQEILDRLVSKYPYAEFADSATWFLGVYFIRELKDFASAEVEFKRLVDNYARSRWRPNAIFMLGYSHFGQFKGIDYDPGPLESAIQILEFYMRDYPEGNRVKQAGKYRAMARGYLAKKLFAVGAFYERENKPASAVLSYEHILRDYADTPQAKAAEEKRAEMHAKVKQLAAAAKKGKTQ
jgi:outer membrane assembly lipoprotein YfiO